MDVDRIEAVARAMSTAMGHVPDDVRPATGYSGAPLIPNWWLEREWAARHIAANEALAALAPTEGR